MKILIYLLRNHFFSKKTEARATRSPWIFFFPLVTPTISTPCLPGIASKATTRTLRPRCPARSRGGPRSRPCREVRRGSCWLTKLPKKLSGSQESELCRSAGLGEGRWRRRDSNRSRCRGRGRSLTVDEGGQTVHHGWEIWEGSLGALRGRGRGGWGWGEEEQRGRPGKPSQRLRELVAEDFGHLGSSLVCVDSASNLRFLSPRGVRGGSPWVGELFPYLLGPSAACWTELVCEAWQHVSRKFAKVSWVKDELWPCSGSLILSPWSLGQRQFKIQKVLLVMFYCQHGIYLLACNFFCKRGIWRGKWAGKVLLVSDDVLNPIFGVLIERATLSSKASDRASLPNGAQMKVQIF